MTNDKGLIHAPITRAINGAFFEVYNYYGYGLSESVYCGALELELMDRGHHVVREVLVEIDYKERHAAWQRLDMIVDNFVFNDTAATEKLPSYSERQLL